jgi:hypothetical protein
MNRAVWAAALFFSATSCLVSLYLGQDANYDLKNYHLYNAWSLLNGRWSQDLVAAGPQTFFSPFLDIPYYLAAAHLLPAHDALLVALAGLPYGVLLWFVYLIARRIADCLELGKWDRGAAIAASVLLGGTGAATWSEIGTTFNDITVAAMVLAALHQVLIGSADSEAGPSPRKVAVAGVLLGLATGLKLTGAMYVPSMAVAMFAVAHGWRNRIRGLAIYGFWVLAAFAAIYGPWAWRLYDLTGNPFFPLFNGIFHSDWITGINVRDDRFMPRSWMQWASYPFYWATLQSGVVTEVPFRDVRFAMAYVFLASYAAIALACRQLRAQLFFGRYRAVQIVVLFFAVSYVVWLVAFSVFRYLVAAECIAGVLIVIGTMAVARRWARKPKWMPAFCAISIAGLIVIYNVSPQWGRAPVGTDLLAVHAPTLDDGALVIFTDGAMSFLAPALAATHRDLRFMTIPHGFSREGQFGVHGFHHELGRRMKAKIAENGRALYVLFLDWARSPQSDLAAFDIEMDMASCQRGRSGLRVEFVACRAMYRGQESSPRQFRAALEQSTVADLRGHRGK